MCSTITFSNKRNISAYAYNLDGNKLELVHAIDHTPQQCKHNARMQYTAADGAKTYSLTYFENLYVLSRILCGKMFILLESITTKRDSSWLDRKLTLMKTITRYTLFDQPTIQIIAYVVQNIYSKQIIFTIIECNIWCNSPNSMICTSFKRWDSVLFNDARNIKFEWLHAHLQWNWMYIFYYENQNMAVRKIVCRIASNWANKTILGLFKRRESQVFNDSQNIKFATFGGKIHWHWLNICFFEEYFYYELVLWKKKQ